MESYKEKLNRLKEESLMPGGSFKEKYEPSYWNNRGKYEKEDGIIHDKYFANAPRNSILKTGNSAADRALLKLVKASNAYYRFYNDGDTMVIGSNRFVYKASDDDDFRKIDKLMDELILNAWKLTNKATLDTK